MMFDRFFERILRWWWARQRVIDMSILWPECKKHARDLERARAAFAVHVFNDWAWTKVYTHDELYQIIDNLE